MSKTIKKDGTRYLCLVQFENDEINWVVLRWGEACGLSKNSDEPCWLENTTSMAPKLKKIISYSECEPTKEWLKDTVFKVRRPLSVDEAAENLKHSLQTKVEE